jgi:curved DNA-binding protein CbpA
MSEQVDPALELELLDFESKLATADYFTLLGLKKGATADEVKKAFYQLSRRLHPDRHFRRAPAALKARLLKVFRVVSKAHQTLTNPGLREAYLNAHPELKPPPPPKVVSTKHNKRMSWNMNDLNLKPPGEPEKK